MPLDAGLPDAWTRVLPAWATALLTAAVLAALLFGARALLLGRLQRLSARTTNHVDDLVYAVLARTTGWFLWLLSLSAGLAVLALPPAVEKGLRVATVAGIGLQVGLWLTTLAVGAIRLWSGDDREQSPSLRTTFGALRFLVHLVVWSAVVLHVLANLGVDVTALVAGLGVGGVAVALAVQNILGDLFASLSIVLDQPFTVGDFIIVDDFMGTVEKVGLKTTRLRSLGGEQLIFSNAKLLEARIRNYQRMQERRVVFSVGVTYETPPEQVRAIPGLIREAIEAAPDTRFDRAHFKEYGDSALVMEAVYYVLSADYNRYMDIQQEINFGLMVRFGARDIDFAYPTQTLHLVRPRRPGGDGKADAPLVRRPATPAPTTP